MKFLSLSLMGLLLTVSNVYASEENEKKEGYSLTFSNPPLFMNSQPTDSVTFSMEDLIVANLSQDNKKAKLLYQVLMEIPPYNKALKKMPLYQSITLHGITIADIGLASGEEHWPATLNEKVQNEKNNLQFDVSFINDYNDITINKDFLGTLKSASTKGDKRAEKLSSVLEKTGIIAYLNSQEKEYSYTIPKDLLAPTDLDGYEEVSPKKLRKLQNIFGLNLKDAKITKLLSDINPTQTIELTSKEKIREAVLNTYKQRQGEIAEITSTLNAKMKDIEALDKELKTTKASVEELTKKHLENEKTIEQKLKEIQELTKKHLEDEKTIEQQLKEKEALAKSLQDVKTKASEFLALMSEESQNLSIELK